MRSGGGGVERGCNEEWGRDGEGGAVRSGGGMERGEEERRGKGWNNYIDERLMCGPSHCTLYLL